MLRPRALPFNAVKEIDCGGKDYWIEYDGHCYPAMVLNINNDVTTVVFGIVLRNGYAPAGNFQNAKYGKRWRCWSSRPTPEQREATPWNS